VAGASPDEGFAVFTVKLCVTDGAALKLTLPAWLAVIEQVPALSSVTSTEAFVQTEGVVEVKIIGRRELAWAAIGKGEIPKIRLGTASNVIVCEALVTLKLRVTGGAGA